MIKTSRLILKKLNKKDIPQLIEIINDKEISKFTEHIHFPFTEKEASELIKSRKDSKQFGIFLENNLIGVIDLYKIKETQAKLGYWIGKEFRNKGYASESIEAIIKYAFKKLKLKNLIARTRLDNKISIKILEKTGFKIKEHFEEDEKKYLRWGLTNPYLY